MKPKKEEIEFEDAESYSYNYSKDKLTFKDIILQHLRKLTELSSVEFRGGYTIIVTTRAGDSKENYIPDSREIFINAVQVFADMLYPYFDDDMKTNFNTLGEALEKSGEEFMEASSVKETIILGSSYYNNDKDRILHEQYKQGKLGLYKILFRDLCCFLYRKKYLELGIIED